jgi:REP element-mobilizing transposase RayT
VPSRRPLRLHRSLYIGLHAYFLTVCAFDGRRVFADDATASATCEQFLRISRSQRFAVLAYCLMPDHFHALVEAEREDCDFVRLVDRFKQQTGFAHKKRTGSLLWQTRYFDRVLRDDDVPIAVARYIICNPLRAGLCDRVEEYRHVGSSRYSLAEIVASVQVWNPGGRSRGLKSPRY